MAEAKAPFAVLGAGSYGTALALLLARNGHPVCLWGRDPAHVEILQRERCNQKYLPDARFPDNLKATVDMAEAADGSRDILVAVPSHAFRETLRKLKPLLRSNSRVVWASKGLDPDNGDLLGDVLKEELGTDIPHAILSGPTFAREMALGLPTAISLAASTEDFARDLAKALHSDRFRVYLSSDLVGVQLGGAIKNVIAIGAGIADGLNYGANARTALITRGLVEMTRLGVAVGGEASTFNGMAGLGDLVLTCTDDQSRNRRFGLALGKGKSREQAEADIGQVVEGVRNASEVRMLAQRYDVEMPIVEAVYRIIYEGEDAATAAKRLLARTLKAEN